MSALLWNKLLKNAKTLVSVSTGESWLMEDAVCRLYLFCLFLQLLSSWKFHYFSCVSDVTCPRGLVYDECRLKLDDFCFRGFVKSIWSSLNKKKTKAERSELLSLLDAQREDSWYFTGAQEYWLFLSRRQIQGWKSLGYLRFWMSLWVKCKDNRPSAYEIPSKCWILIVALYFVHQTAKGHLGNPGW